jgi:hypothetical protein
MAMPGQAKDPEGPMCQPAVDGQKINRNDQAINLHSKKKFAHSYALWIKPVK